MGNGSRSVQSTVVNRASQNPGVGVVVIIGVSVRTAGVVNAGVAFVAVDVDAVDVIDDGKVVEVNGTVDGVDNDDKVTEEEEEEEVEEDEVTATVVDVALAVEEVGANMVVS